MGGFVASPPPTPEASEDEDDDDGAIASDRNASSPVLTRCLLDTFTLCHS